MAVTDRHTLEAQLENTVMHIVGNQGGLYTRNLDLVTEIIDLTKIIRNKTITVMEDKESYARQYVAKMGIDTNANEVVAFNLVTGRSSKINLANLLEGIESGNTYMVRYSTRDGRWLDVYNSGGNKEYTEEMFKPRMAGLGNEEPYSLRGTPIPLGQQETYQALVKASEEGFAEKDGRDGISDGAKAELKENIKQLLDMFKKFNDYNGVEITGIRQLQKDIVTRTTKSAHTYQQMRDVVESKMLTNVYSFIALNFKVNVKKVTLSEGDKDVAERISREMTKQRFEEFARESENGIYQQFVRNEDNLGRIYYETKGVYETALLKIKTRLMYKQELGIIYETFEKVSEGLLSDAVIEEMIKRNIRGAENVSAFDVKKLSDDEILNSLRNNVIRTEYTSSGGATKPMWITLNQELIDTYYINPKQLDKERQMREQGEEPAEETPRRPRAEGLFTVFDLAGDEDTRTFKTIKKSQISAMADKSNWVEFPVNDDTWFRVYLEQAIPEKDVIGMDRKPTHTGEKSEFRNDYEEMLKERKLEYLGLAEEDHSGEGMSRIALEYYDQAMGEVEKAIEYIREKTGIDERDNALVVKIAERFTSYMFSDEARSERFMEYGYEPITEFVVDPDYNYFKIVMFDETYIIHPYFVIRTPYNRVFVDKTEQIELERPRKKDRELMNITPNTDPRGKKFLMEVSKLIQGTRRYKSRKVRLITPELLAEMDVNARKRLQRKVQKFMALGRNRTTHELYKYAYNVEYTLGNKGLGYIHMRHKDDPKTIVEISGLTIRVIGQPQFIYTGSLGNTDSAVQVARHFQQHSDGIHPMLKNAVMSMIIHGYDGRRGLNRLPNAKHHQIALKRKKMMMEKAKEQQNQQSQQNQ